MHRPVEQADKVEDGSQPPVPGGLVDEGQGHPDVAVLLLPAEQWHPACLIPEADLALLPEPLVESLLLTSHLEIQ